MSAVGDLFLAITGGDPLLLGLLGGMTLAALNASGAAPVLLLRRLPSKFDDVALGFAAGVMLAASFTSLILPGVELGGILPVVAGVVLGAGAMTIGDRLIPHMHRIIGEEGKGTRKLKAVWLFIIAITLHNMPEGMAVGVGLGSGDMASAVTLMIAIGLQNIPEGLSVAFSLLEEDRSRRRIRSFVVSALSGLVEIPMCVLGAWGVTAASQVLPYALGFAGGAMIFVISDEIIPETHRLGHERLASYGLIVGLVVMLVLDVALA